MSPMPQVFCYASFNLSALVSHAEELRSAPCSCDSSQQPMAGSHNWAIVLTFDDGGEDWIFRSPRPDNGFSEQTNQKMIESEVASIRFSKLNGIPVVEIKSYCGSRSNEVGVPYILATRAPGFSISSRFVWNSDPECMKKPRYPLPCLSREAKTKIISQLGQITSQILKQPVDKIGSLREKDGQFYVEECLSRALTWCSRDSFRDIARGPFKNDQEYYESLLSALCRHAEELPLEQHLFLAPVPKPEEFSSYSSYRSAVQAWNDFVTVGSKIENTKNRLDYITAAHLLRDVVPSISTKEQKYYLKPPDLSASNIFIDDDFNITCIIDWTSCFTVPLSTLLITPGFPHPRDEVDVAMIAVFKDSVTCSSPTIKEVLDPLSWDLARKSWLFMQLVDLDSLQDYFHFIELYTSVQTDANKIDARQYFNALRQDDVFIRQAKKLLKEDPPASEVHEMEKAYFAHRPPGAEILARKLTQDADLDQQFIGDSKFWKQMGEALQS